MRTKRREASTCPAPILNITEQNRMKKYLEIAIVAYVTIAVAKHVPVLKNYV